MRRQAWTMAATATMVALAISGLPEVAQAEVGEVIRLQGRLLSKGGPVPDGDYGVAVRFYKAKGDGLADAVFAYVSPGVKVTSGVFALTLGEALKLDVKAFTSGDAAFVGIQVGSDPEFPRLPLHQVPYALRAKVATTVACTGCIGAEQVDPKLLDGYAKTADLAPFAKSAELHKVAKSGKYADLTGGPDLSPFAKTADLAPFAKNADLHKVAKSGKYADLTGGPDLSPFAKSADLHKVAKSGNYADLTGKPDLAPYAKTSALAAFAKNADLHKVAKSGKYADLAGKPPLAKLTKCQPGQVLNGFNIDGSQICVADKDTKNTYTGKHFAVSDKLCGGALIQRGVDANGIPVCVADKNTQNVYTGANFALSNRICNAGQVMRGILNNGLPNCIADKDTQNTYTGANFAVSNKVCPAGQVMRGILNNGLPNCIADKDTKNTYNGTNFAISGKGCTGGKVLRGIKADGTPDCFTGNLNMQNAKINSVATPSATTDAANKAYVDSAVTNAVAASPARLNTKRRYTVVMSMRSKTYCPPGWTADDINTVRGPNLYAYMYLHENGFYMGGMYSPSISHEYLYARIHHNRSITHICHKTFDSTSGNPHVAVMSYKGTHNCPAKYHKIPSIQLARNGDNYIHSQATDGGMFIGGLDDWAHTAHGYGDGGTYQQFHYNTAMIDTVCLRVMGVDDFPETANGVFPVFLGTSGDCPTGFNNWATSSLDGSNGWYYWMTQRAATFFGGHNSWGHGGGAWQQVHYRPGDVKRVCWKFMHRTHKPYVQVRTPQVGGCPTGFTTMASAAIKGTNAHAYVQLTGQAFFAGGLYSWAHGDYDSGLWAHDLYGQLGTNFCFKIEGAQ